jgi:tol-pal system protein YbgF
MLAALLFGAGCASSAQASKDADQAKQLQARIEELERTNGRLTVRVEELEDQLYLLHDRVEAQRIAMQRRAPAVRDAYAYASPRAPSPAPESYYNDGDAYQGQGRVREAAPRRTVTRIPIHDEDAMAAQDQADVRSSRQAPPVQPARAEDEVVITEEQFREFERQYGSSSHSAPASQGPNDRPRGGQPPVTDERIEQGRGLGKAATPLAAAPKAQPAVPAAKAAAPIKSDKTGLAAYKEGLSEYRAGNYSQALGHFESFMSSNPQEDYVDNTLYWIGECHYGLGDFDKAISNFERVLKEQPNGNKVPDAMLKMFLALERSGRRDEADRVLRDLTERYPTTNAGRLGLQKLNERR